jgi:hypothetical protein
MSETLFDFSKKISDQEFVTHEKVKNLVDSININKIVIKKYNNVSLDNFVVTFPKKQLFFTVTLYGGGSSGIKSDYNSTFANGGYSSGTIVRFPIEINNIGGNYFALIHVGEGGQSFNISERILVNNGTYTNFDLYTGNEEVPENSYETLKGRKSGTLVEGLSSYGAGRLYDDSIIEEVSTLTYFGFKGSNSTNTFKINSGEHRNYYAPYISEYNGYNSLNGLGGDYLGDIDGEEDSGAGGAGVFNGSSTRVGKGGNGACILEYEGVDKIKVYVQNYILINNESNQLFFFIYDSGVGKREISIPIELGIYNINNLVSLIQSYLNEYVDANVSIDEEKLLIKMDRQWSVSLNSSNKLLTILGIKNSDIYVNNEYIKAEWKENSFQLKFSGSILSVCPIESFQNQSIF